MSLLENSIVVGAACLAAGSVAGYWLWRWKDRNLRDALALKEQSALDDARRQAETILREARLQVGEDAQQLRRKTEDSFATSRQEMLDAEKRLAERESIINRQFEGVVVEEKRLREQQQACERKSTELDLQRRELGAVIHHQAKV